MTPGHIKPLTGARFPAALAVVLFHLKGKMAAAGLTWAPAAFGGGYLAVPFFFILSGLILAHVYFPGYRLAEHGRFIWLRFARLFPVHLAMTAAMVAMAGAWVLYKGHNPHSDQPWPALALELLMVRSWADATMLWNIPAWSIQIEWFAYLLLFPACAAVIRPMSNPWALGLLAIALLLAHPLVMPRLPGHLGTIPCLFMAGCALYRLRTVLPGLQCGNAIVWLAMTGGAIAWRLGLPSAVYLAFAGILFGLSYEQGLIARLLSTRAMVYGGELSFSLYMSHHVVNTATYDLWGKLGVDTHVWPIAVTLMGSLLAAVVVHHAIEIPANRWLRSPGTGRLTVSVKSP